MRRWKTEKGGQRSEVGAKNQNTKPNFQTNSKSKGPNVQTVLRISAWILEADKLKTYQRFSVSGFSHLGFEGCPLIVPRGLTEVYNYAY
jgi:hypothetical protein